jgi:hypothetical protein
MLVGNMLALQRRLGADVSVWRGAGWARFTTRAGAAYSGLAGAMALGRFGRVKEDCL